MDVAGSDVYWADDWVTDPYAFRIAKPQLSGDAGGGGAAGSGGAFSVGNPGAAIRALAAGQPVCDGQVTISETRTRVGCASSAGPGMIRTGAEIEFNGCTLEDGGTLSGMIAVSGTHTASDDDCDADTVIDVSYTSTITGLSYTSGRGRRVDLVSWSNTGSYSRTVMGPPTDLEVSSSGSLERYDSDGDLVADLTLGGTRSYTFGSDDQGTFYAVSGSVSAQDRLRGQATITGNDVTRRANCCRPVDGTLAITTSDRGTTNISYGPACGRLSVDGNQITARSCF
jgi:hypothetical protein